MFSLLSNFLIYSYNDMAGVMISFLSKKDGVNYMYGQVINNSVGRIDLISNYLFFTLSNISNYIFANNFLVLTNVLLTFIFSYLLFKDILKSRAVSFVFSLLTSFSLQYIFRVISFTQNLYSVFVFPLLAYFLIKKSNKILISLYILLVFLISSYYGFFCFIIALFWELSLLVLKKESLVEFSKKILQIILPLFISLILFYPTFIINNLPMFGKYSKPVGNDSRNELQVYRPIEDYYNFSFRPWYFFIPPKTSLFFSDTSKRIYDRIASTNYYLADDYSEEEMGGTFMGWHFLLGMCVVGFLLLLNRFKSREFTIFKSIYENKETIVISFLMIFFILLISGPPSFTIRGIEIFTPSYLLYYVVPVFRTIVRWSVVIYLFVLIINSYLVLDLYNLAKTALQRLLFILMFLSLNFIIFSIKIPIININKPPQEIAFVKNEFPGNVPYAVYPKGDYYSIFWINSSKDILINSVDTVDLKIGFKSNDFSRSLITDKGIEDFLNKKPKYLIYYQNGVLDNDLKKIFKRNVNITSKEDIHIFFSSYFGDPVFAQNSIFVYKVETK